MPRLMLACHRCEIDLSTCDSPALHGYDSAALQAHVNLCLALQSGHDIDRGKLDVMHHLSRLMQSSTDRLKLQAFAAQRLGAPHFPRSAKRISIESRELEERHHYMLLINWLMDDLESRLNQAREAKTLRYLHLKRDFEDPPPWYGALVARFERRASAVVTLRSLSRQANSS
jgi:hypothetical protein